MKLAWSNDKPFDFAGEFYRVKGALSDVHPLQKPHPPLFFGGASDGALEMGAQALRRLRDLCRAARLDARAHAAVSRAGGGIWTDAGFQFSVRPIIAESEGAAWDKANKILAAMTGEGGKKGWSRQEAMTGPVDNAGRPTDELCARKRRA